LTRAGASVLGLRDDLTWAVQQALDETHNALESAVENRHPAAVVARLADLARSNAFLWLETGLKAPARLSQVLPGAGVEQPPSAVAMLDRALVLGAVAAVILQVSVVIAVRGRWCHDVG